MAAWADVVVVGGGPAGAAAALALARAGAAVILLERSTCDRPRPGEMLPPVACLPLAELGVWDQFRAAGHLPSPGVCCAWGQADPFDQDFICHPYGNGWHLDRQAFDRMLRGAAVRAGVRVWRGVRLQDCRRDRRGMWELVGRGGETSWRAPYVIDATGQAATLAGRLGSRRLVFDRLVGVVGLARLRPGTSVDARTLVEADADGWWYSALIPGSRLVVCYLTDVDLLPRGAGPLRTSWEARLRRCPHTCRRCERGEVEGSLAIVATRSQRLEPAAGPGWCAVGDAAMTFDPLSSQGITKALASGLAAARTITAGRAEEIRLAEFANRVREEFEGYLRTRQAIYGREQRWRDSPFWSRRQGDAAGTAHHGHG